MTRPYRNVPLTGNAVQELLWGFHPTKFANREARRAPLQKTSGNNRRTTPGRKKQYVKVMALADYSNGKGLKVVLVSTGKTKLIRHSNFHFATY